MTSNRAGARRVGAGATSRPDASTSLVLVELLTGDGRYRRRWRSEVRRASERDPHQGAVAQVLAQHLWDTGEVAESDADLPRRLKDVVARAVAGRGISHQTLSWFVAAFDMAEDDERALWRQLEADQRRERTTPAPIVRPVSAAERPRSTRSRAGYRTQSLVEQFEVGSDRTRRRHTLVHIIRAQASVDRVTYRFDTPEVAVEVVRGGTTGPLEPDYAPGMFTLDILLPAPLEPGGTAALETVATYPPGGEPLHDFHRGLRATAGGVSLEVRFHAEAVPSQVRWTEISGTEPGQLLTEPATLSPDHVVHRFVTPQQDCAVGFEWDW